MNVLSLELISELGRALEAAEECKAAAMILTRSGRAFCAGADLKLMSSSDSRVGCSPMDIRDHIWRRSPNYSMASRNNPTL